MCPEKIGEEVKLYARAIQRLKEYKVKWFSEEEIDDDDIFLVSVDGIHCCMFEVRRDPGGKWYFMQVNQILQSSDLVMEMRKIQDQI